MLKLNLGCGKFPLEGFLNMDYRRDLSRIFKERNPGEFVIVDNWTWQEGFAFEDNLIDAVTESHSLMFLKAEEYISAFLEVSRILKPGGVFRITEDNCEHSEEKLEELGLPWGNPASTTGPKMMMDKLTRVFVEVKLVSPEETAFYDNSLIQQFHGTPPRVFHMEAMK